MVEYFLGVDGCKSGWLAAKYEPGKSTFDFFVHSDFPRLLSSHPYAAKIAIDMPIGLTESCEPRQCDQIARRLVGPRRSSIFPAPDRRILEIETFDEASKWSRGVSGKGITRQAFAIYGKILEVDRVITAGLQNRVFEVHPEVCFWNLAGQRPLTYPKRKVAGFDERSRLLAGGFPEVEVPNRENALRLATGVAPDDVLDSLVALWTATRVGTGRARSIPPMPPVDHRGLRMEMVY